MTKDTDLNLSRMISMSEIDLSKFRYLELKKHLNSESLLNTLFIKSKHGKKKSRNDYRTYVSDYADIVQKDNVYHSIGQPIRKRIKQSYLNSIHNQYFVIRRVDLLERTDEIYYDFGFRATYPTVNDFINSNDFQTIQNIQDEYFEIIKNNSEDYNEIVIPEDYKANYGRKKINKDVLKMSIPVKFGNRSTKQRIPMKVLMNFKGKIFYGTTDDEYTSNVASRLFGNLFDDKYIANYYRSRGFDKNESIMFITVAKNNIKYIKYIKNAYPLSMFREKMLYRKTDKIISHFTNVEIKRLYDELEYFYTSDLFKSISPQLSNTVDNVMNYFDNIEIIDSLSNHKEYLRGLIDINNIDKPAETKVVEKLILKLLDIQKNNENILQYIKISRYGNIIDKETDDKMLPMILKKLLIL